MMMMEARRESLEVGGEILWGESVTRERGQEGMPCCKYQPCDDHNGGQNNVMMPGSMSIAHHHDHSQGEGRGGE